MLVVVGMVVVVDKLVIIIGYVDGWLDSVVIIYVVVEVICEKFGYEVKLMLVVVGIMWQGVVCGKFDVMFLVWLLGIYGVYYEKMKDKVVNFVINYLDVCIGLIVFEYVSVNSIVDFQVQKDVFGGCVVGIDVGVGVMIKIDEVIK